MMYTDIHCYLELPKPEAFRYSTGYFSLLLVGVFSFCQCELMSLKIFLVSFFVRRRIDWYPSNWKPTFCFLMGQYNKHLFWKKCYRYSSVLNYCLYPAISVSKESKSLNCWILGHFILHRIQSYFFLAILIKQARVNIWYYPFLLKTYNLVFGEYISDERNVLVSLPTFQSGLGIHLGEC